MKSKEGLSVDKNKHGSDLLTTIVYAGVVAGVLDAVDGVLAYYLSFGMNPVQVLQFIASGALGEKAFEGGLLTAAVGALFHFFIALVVAAIFCLAACALPILVRHRMLLGLAYGATVYLVMNYGVLPLSAVKQAPFSWPLFLNGLIGHAVFVGLPIAWFASRPHLAAATVVARQIVTAQNP